MEYAETNGTNRVGSLLHEFSSLGGVGAGGGKIAAVQFCRGEIDQNQHALPLLGQAGIADCCGEHRVRGCGRRPARGCNQWRRSVENAVVVKRRRVRTAAGPVEGGVCMVECVAR